jgi:hypothetical protein
MRAKTTREAIAGAPAIERSGHEIKGQEWPAAP